MGGRRGQHTLEGDPLPVPEAADLPVDPAEAIHLDEFSFEELLAEIGDRRPANDPGLSVEELAAHWGKSAGLVRRNLKYLKAQGKLQIGTRIAPNLNNKDYALPVYRLRRGA